MGLVAQNSATLDVRLLNPKPGKDLSVKEPFAGHKRRSCGRLEAHSVHVRVIKLLNMVQVAENRSLNGAFPKQEHHPQPRCNKQRDILTKALYYGA